MEDLSRDELDQLIGVFREQTLQILDEMGHDLLALEASGGDPEAMTRLKRCAHTIKGDSACLGMEGVASISHKIEDVLEAAVHNETGIDEAVVDLILGSLDLIREAVEGEEVSDISEGTLVAFIKRLGAAEAGELSDLGKKHFTAAAAEEAEGGGKSREGGGVSNRRDFIRVE